MLMFCELHPTPVTHHTTARAQEPNETRTRRSARQQRFFTHPNALLDLDVADRLVGNPFHGLHRLLGLLRDVHLGTLRTPWARVLVTVDRGVEAFPLYDFPTVVDPGVADCPFRKVSVAVVPGITACPLCRVTAAVNSGVAACCLRRVTVAIVPGVTACPLRRVTPAVNSGVAACCPRRVTVAVNSGVAACGLRRITAAVDSRYPACLLPSMLEKRWRL